MESPFIQAIILGIIQGLTEFLPVSSSGRLALAQQLLPNFNQPGVLLDVLLHAGTLIAIIIYLRKDLIQFTQAAIKIIAPNQDPDPNVKKLIFAVIIAQFPTAIIGLTLQDPAEDLFSSPVMIGAALITTAAVLAAGEIMGRKRDQLPQGIGWAHAIIIGVVQGIAVVPGLSRSGTTISAARALGISGPEAARFSFLASIPAVAGATLITVIQHRDQIAAFDRQLAAAYVIGPIVAAIIGYVAISAVMRLMTGNRLHWFAPYCAALGAAAVIISIII